MEFNGIDTHVFCQSYIVKFTIDRTNISTSVFDKILFSVCSLFQIGSDEVFYFKVSIFARNNWNQRYLCSLRLSTTYAVSPAN